MQQDGLYKTLEHFEEKCRRDPTFRESSIASLEADVRRLYPSTYAKKLEDARVASQEHITIAEFAASELELQAETLQNPDTIAKTLANARAARAEGAIDARLAYAERLMGYTTASRAGAHTTN